MVGRIIYGIYNKPMALITRLPDAERVERNRKIAEYAIQYPDLSYRQLGELFGLSTMTVYNAINKEDRPKRIRKERHYCDKCGSPIAAPLPKLSDLPTSVEGDSALVEVAE